MEFKYFLKHKIVPYIKKFLRNKNKFPLIPNSQEYKIRQILMAGGYGYTNAGDEAQCNATANLLTELFPDYQLKILSPNPNNTFLKHQFASEHASRVAFWGQGQEINLYDFKESKIEKALFLLRGAQILLSAWLMKHKLPPFFLGGSATKLLQEIKSSSLFFFSGGGFLTGKTLSRLWDGIFICKICEIFNVPVVMSGQTIGVWGNEFNKKFASWGFKKVKIITSRDVGYTLKALEELDLDSKIYETHDDALFCEKSKEKFYEGDYITINFHNWGANPEEIEQVQERFHQIVQKLPYKCIFLAMVGGNEKDFEEYNKKYPNEIEIFDGDFDFRKIRKVIADSKLCVTMKHHPIIFAYGENIPVISIVHSDYYYHKNKGAQAQYGQEDCNIMLDDPDFLEKFENLLEKTLENKTCIKTIKTSKEKLKKQKELFIEDVKRILE
jgi:polysaccharide pyruvyl transferase WcaK-like protein